MQQPGGVPQWEIEQVKYLIFMGQGAEARLNIMRVIFYLTATTMVEIIDVALAFRDVKTLELCIREYPRRWQLRLTKTLQRALSRSERASRRQERSNSNRIRIALEEIITTLLNYHVDYTHNNGEEPAMLTAITMNRQDVLVKLVDLGASVEEGWVLRVVEAAANKQNKEYFAQLVRSGFNIESDFNDEESQYTDAIRREDVTSITALWAVGVAVCRGDLKAACMASLRVMNQILQYFNRRGGQLERFPELLISAVEAPVSDNIRNMEELLRRGLIPDSQDEGGMYAVQAAIRRGSIDALRLLIERGARVDVLTPDGKDLLQFAIEERQHDIVKEILDSRLVDCDRVYKGGNALKMAIMEYNYEATESLVEHGVQLYTRDPTIRYIPPLRLLNGTISQILPLLAREVGEGRYVNEEDVQVLEDHYPDLYKEYLNTCHEWKLMQKTFIGRVSYAQLVEMPPRSLLRAFRTVTPEYAESCQSQHRFPTYGKSISKSLSALMEARSLWIAESEELDNILWEHLPNLVSEEIAYHLTE